MRRCSGSPPHDADHTGGRGVAALRTISASHSRWPLGLGRGRHIEPRGYAEARHRQFLVRQWTDVKMAKPDDVAVMLEHDVAAFLASKAQQVLKFAAGDQRCKGCAVQVVCDH